MALRLLVLVALLAAVTAGGLRARDTDVSKSSPRSRKAPPAHGPAGPPPSALESDHVKRREDLLPPTPWRKGCGLHILTSFFVTREDWQSKRKTVPSFAYMETFYKSAIATGANVTIVHDSLPDALVRNKTTPAVNFVRVRLDDYGKQYGLNDIRFLIFADLVKSHPDWAYAFHVDISDVVLVRNPCEDLQPRTLYVGSEARWRDISVYQFMRSRFEEMGSKYLRWYRERSKGLQLFNCGIAGGARDVVADFYDRVGDVIKDPHLAVRERGGMVNVNMGATNYVLYNQTLPFRVVTGDPVHSVFGSWENDRNDTWFLHKML